MTTPSFTVDALTAALPETTGTLSLPGLDGPIAIYRDRWGIPHVRAGSVHDAFFGQGFVHAQDRLWQMDADRRRASGRWAAVVGPAGLEQDVLMRRFRLVASARADYEQGIDAETRATLDAYADGVNAFVELARASGRLPVEYRLLDEVPAAWRPWDSLLVYKVRHVQMGVWEAKVWRARLVNQVGPAMAARLLPGYAPGHLLVVPPGAAYSGPPLDGLEILEQGAAVVGLVPAVGGRGGGGGG
ncbi:MAG: penicillin acylase family protein, partial [Chloroflexi bacterium]|nr:penicillin acylase family protein [Chloroflexota bacterium]